MQGIQFDWLRELFPDLPPERRSMLGIAETGSNTAISKRFLPARRMPAGIPPAKAPTQQPTRQRTHHLRQRQHQLLLFRAQLGGVSAGQRIGQHLRGQLATGRGLRPGSRIATIGFRQQRTQHRMRQQLQSRIGIAALVRVQLAADEVSDIGRQCIGRDLTSALSRHTTHQLRRHCVQCTVVLIEAPHFPAPLYAWLFAAAPCCAQAPDSIALSHKAVLTFNIRPIRGQINM
ncbi:hypothetical protein NIPOLPBK_02687 [Stenotrophomonas maltophilia]|nr:hypothetical protein NIPOLPBK_02687 [Stenotrophomonas maltophilia]WBL66352.1 hypothetical protein SMAL454_01290 [Stenotrophomonas maltophilia]